MDGNQVFRRDYVRIIRDDAELANLTAHWENLTHYGRLAAWKIRRGETDVGHASGARSHLVVEYFGLLQQVSERENTEVAALFDEVYVAACGRHGKTPDINKWGAAKFNRIWAE
jgi:hypothetical protein